jgi:hypothetical protein
MLTALALAPALIVPAAAAADVSFAPQMKLTTSGPSGLAAGDLDGDGALDLVVASPGNSGVSVFRGTGRGRFDAPSLVSVSTAPRSVALLDANSDGLVDVAVSDTTLNSVFYRLATPSGSFDAAADTSDMPLIRTVQAADVDGDGRDDLVSVSWGNRVVVSYQLPGGGYDAGTDIPLPGALFDVATVADVNEDGRLDVVAADGFPGSVVVALQLPGGSFDTPATVSTNSLQTVAPAVAVGDVTGDGHVDVVTPNFEQDDVVVLSGNGDGTFGTAAHHPVGDGPVDVALADLNADGVEDIVTADTFGSSVSYTQSPSFAATTVPSVGGAPQFLVAADVDDDDRVDLAWTTTMSSVVVMRNTSAGSISSPTTSLAFGTTPQSTVSAAQAATLANDGDAALRVSKAEVIGTDPDDFLISGDSCTGTPVRGGGGTCTVRVRFAPTAAGARSATLRLRGDQGSGFVDVPLSGTGGAASAGPQGDPGPQGATGQQGVAGAQGVPGAPGADGGQGSQGTPGANGSQGTAGQAGAAGPTGPGGPARPGAMPASPARPRPSSASRRRPAR